MMTNNQKTSNPLTCSALVLGCPSDEIPVMEVKANVCPNVSSSPTCWHVALFPDSTVLVSLWPTVPPSPSRLRPCAADSAPPHNVASGRRSCVRVSFRLAVDAGHARSVLAPGRDLSARAFASANVGLTRGMMIALAALSSRYISSRLSVISTGRYLSLPPSARL